MAAASAEKCVLVHGASVAAHACHTLLHRFGWRTLRVLSSKSEPAHPVPFIVLNETTWQLWAELFGYAPIPSFETNRRLVASQNTSQVYSSTEIHHVVSTSALHNLCAEAQPSDHRHHFTIETRPQAGTADWISSGNRVAWLCSARTEHAEAAHSLIFEFTPDGWVFWAPSELGAGFLQFVLPQRARASEHECLQLWRSTKLAQEWITPGEDWLARAIPSAACAKRQLVAEQTLYCGSAAMRFDPIAGDGTGSSLRSAILACASLRYAADHPSQKEPALLHYQTRMAQAFRSHLKTCQQHYATAGLSPHWHSEIAALHDAHELAEAYLLKNPTPPQFRLENLSLAALPTR